MGTQTLILNASFEPLHIVSWQKAVQLLFQGKVEVIEESTLEIRTVRFSIKVPSVLRLLKFVSLNRARQVIRFSRANVFSRDSHRCQYCNQHFQKHALTLDHVIPVVQGGSKNWDNIVTSCKPCNQKKGGRTPTQAGMKLVREPVEPQWIAKEDLELSIVIDQTHWKMYFESR